MEQQPTHYINQNAQSPIASVEFSPHGQGKVVFISLRNKAAAEQLTRKFEAELPNCHALGLTHGENGPVLAIRSAYTVTQLKSWLESQGEQLEAPAPDKKKFNPWSIRGKLSIVGQTLQILSGIFQVQKTAPGEEKKGMGWDTIIFAISNLVANFTNVIFGAQVVKDEHQLRYLKQEINEHLSAKGLSDSFLPDVTDQRATKHQDKEPAQKIGTKIYNFAKRYSVSVGEVGLRMFGALALVFPLGKKNISKVKDAYHQDGLGAAFKAGLNTKKFTMYAGIAYILGKVIALMSKVPDPYNPKEKSALDKIREKVTFRASSVIEATAAGFLSYDAFKNKRVEFSRLGLDEDKTYRDDFGGVGGALFTTGLTIRLFAPYGKREVDMKELIAHTADALVMLPREQLAQTVTELSVQLADHFKDKKYSVSQIYALMSEELRMHHGVDVEKKRDGMPDISVERGRDIVVDMPSQSNEKSQSKQFARDEMKREKENDTSHLSHGEKALTSVSKETVAALV